MTKRILLSVLLVLSMVIVFAPSAFAASPAVAKVGSVEYATVEEAIDAANGETVTLLAPMVIASGETVTIDLKGQTVAYTADIIGEAMITNNGTFTVKDSVGGGKIIYTYTGAPDSTYSKGNYTVVNSGIMTVKGGTIENATASMKHASYAISQHGNGTLNVEGGTIRNTNNYAIRQFASGAAVNTINVSGGEIIGTRAVWMQAAGSSSANSPTIALNVTGGKLTGTGESGYTLAVYSYSYGDSMKNMSVSVSGGEIVGDIALTGGKNKTDAEKVTITGGTLTDVYSYAEDDVAEKSITVTGGTFTNPVAPSYCTAVATIGNTYYATIADAITAAQDGDVITLLAGEIDETVSVAKINKTITIKGADNFGTTLTGGIRLGTDNNTADSGKVTIDGIVFSGKGLALVELAEATVTNNKFTNITDKSAILVLCDNLTDKVVVSDNEIDTTADAGIRVRTPKALTITDNKVKNTAHNSITVEYGSTYPANTGAIVITGNTLENWGTSGEGRALRLAMGSGDAEKDVTFERNVMIHTDAPEEFAKITDAPEATVSVDENYWGGMDPHDAGFIAPEVPANYYTNSALTALAVYRAKLGDIYFVNVADAIAAADEGDIVEMLVSVPEDDFVLAVGVGLKSSAAIDAYISAPRDYVIERTYTAGGYLYTVAGTVFGVDLTPKSYTLLAGNSVQFFATVSGTTDETGVIWRLEGDHKYSYITRNGVLVASLADKTCNVTVTAISAYDTTKSASVTITIYNPFADANGRFSDVKTSAWYYDSVEYVYNEGLMLGTSETQFSPNMTVSRAMIVTILWRLEGSPVVTDDVAFPDLKDGEWYTDAAKWAAANKLVLGYDNGNFGAEDDITHEQILALFNRYADYKNLKSESASNANVYYTYSDWAKDNVMWGAANGLFDRMNSDAVSLANAANRAEIAAYLAQFCRNIIK